jgi:hypothetical protein
MSDETSPLSAVRVEPVVGRSIPLAIELYGSRVKHDYPCGCQFWVEPNGNYVHFVSSRCDFDRRKIGIELPNGYFYRAAPSVLDPAYTPPNAPHEGPGAASSRTVPLDAVVVRQKVSENE